VSLETLLLLAFFILTPLIQRLLQAARQGDGTRRTPERAPQPPSGTAPVPRRAPPAPLIPSRPTVTPEVAADEMTAPAPSSAREAVAPAAAPAVTPRHDMRRSTAAAGLRGRRLRRAIVLKEILGPCRAVNPYDWHQGA
jgi:hypothetical protein